jgi:hypothetical protein
MGEKQAIANAYHCISRRIKRLKDFSSNVVRIINGTPENAEQARSVGKWLDKRSPLLQCGYGILVGRGAQESDLLGCAWSS